MHPGRVLLLAAVTAAHLGGFWWLMQERVRSAAPLARAEPEATQPAGTRPQRRDRPEVPPQDPSLPHASPAAERATSPEPETDESAPAAPAVRDDVRPLPPHDTPLVQVKDALEARARAGDRRASCRLATDGMLCEQQSALRNLVTSIERGAAQQEHTPETSVDALARLEPQLDRAERICADLPDAWIADNVWRHALDAAQSTPQLATRVAMNPQLPGRLADRPLQSGVPQETAASLLQRAARAGDPLAIHQLHRIHSGVQRQHPTTAIAPDPRLALVYGLVLQRLVDDEHAAVLQSQIDTGRAALTPEQWAAIEAEAAAFHEQAFADRVPPVFDPDVIAPLEPQVCELP